MSSEQPKGPVNAHVLNADGVSEASIRYEPDPKHPGGVRAVIEFGTLTSDDFAVIDVDSSEKRTTP